MAHSLYLTRYIEGVGSGTQAIISLCKDAGLPEPQFEQRSGFFVVIIWRDWLTDAVVAGLGLNERQRKAIMFLKSRTRISNSEYRAFMGVSKPTASRDLDTLLSKGVVEKIGTTGKGTYYILSGKGLRKGSQGS